MSLINNQEHFEQRVFGIHTHIPGIIFQLKIDAHRKRSMLYVSPAVEKYIGLSVETVLSDVEKWFSLTHPDDRAFLETSIVDSMQNMCIWNWEGRFIRQDNNGVVKLRGTSMPRKMPDDSIIWDGIFVETTEACKTNETENELRRSEQYLNESQKIAKLGHWIWNIIDDEIYWSDESYRIVGAKPGEFTPDYAKFLSFIHPDDREKWRLAVTEAMTANNYNLNHRLLLANGELKYTHGQGKVIYDDAGKPVKMIGTIQDVTQQKKAQVEIERVKARFEVMFDSISDAIVYTDSERNISLINQSATQLFGYSRPELIGNSNSMLYASQVDYLQHEKKRFNSLASEATSSYVIKYRCKNGHEFKGETICTPIKSESGEVSGFLDVTRDVSERLQVDKILKSLAEGSSGLGFDFFLQDVLNHLSELYQTRYALVSRLRPDRKSAETLAFLNNAVIAENFEYRLAGTPCEGLLDKKSDLIPNYASKIFSDDEILIKLNVESFYGAPLVFSDGTVAGVIAVLDTEAMALDAWTKPLLGVFAARVALELERELASQELQLHQHHLEELVDERSQKLIIARDEANRANLAKSEFLSQMSHELRTPLNAILGFTQLLNIDTRQPLGNQQKESVDEITTAGNHLLSLIDEILDLSQVESGHLGMTLEPVDIKPVLETCIKQLQPIASSRDQDIQFFVDGDSIIQADNKRLLEVFINLISNAIKYGLKGGSIKIDSELKGQYLRINIRDNGPGISQEFIPRLFKSFERFSPVELNIEGTGIGLAICEKLIKAMSGNIGVESEIDKGSNFWIELPRA